MVIRRLSCYTIALSAGRLRDNQGSVLGLYLTIGSIPIGAV